MKKLIFLFTFFMAISFTANTTFAQVEKVRDNAAKKEIVSLKEETAKISVLEAKLETLSNAVQNIPDSFLLVVGQDSFYVPVKDGKIIVDTVKEIVDDNKGNWPTSLRGILGLLALVAFGGKFTQVIVSGKNIYNFLKPLLKNTLFIVALVGAVLAAGITFLIGQGEFEFTMFSTVSGWTSFIAVFIYEKWIKPKQPETQPEARA